MAKSEKPTKMEEKTKIDNKTVMNALSSVQQIRESITEASKDCIFMSINGTEVYGKLNEHQHKLEVYDCVDVHDCYGTEDSFKKWVKAFNAGNLKKYRISGERSLTEKTLSENDLLDIERAIINIASKSANVIAKIVNESF